MKSGKPRWSCNPSCCACCREQEFERLGSTKTHRVNVRLIAATNRDLESRVEAKQFRSDLYYRPNVFPITMPLLRERLEDVPTLVRYFAQHYAVRMNKNIHTIPAKTLEILSRYAWPGNIRELENLVERSVILTQGTELQVPLSEFQIDGTRPRATATGTLQDKSASRSCEHSVKSNGSSGGRTGGSETRTETHYPHLKNEKARNYPPVPMTEHFVI
jgi:transcriptional regulator with GAF, ATPase, and Fis domain